MINCLTQVQYIVKGVSHDQLIKPYIKNLRLPSYVMNVNRASCTSEIEKILRK